MRDYSNKAANLFARSGVKKGDMVMLVLKRHYQFWFAVLALHKLGAIGVPATNLLTVKDYVYRFGAAGIKHAVCTAEGEVTARVETACSEYGQLDSKFVVNGARWRGRLRPGPGRGVRPVPAGGHHRRRPHPALLHLRPHRSAQDGLP